MRETSPLIVSSSVRALRLFPKNGNGNGQTKQALDMIFQVLRGLVEEQLKKQGVTLKEKFKETDWFEVYEQLEATQQ